MIPHWLHEVNIVSWIVANLLVGYIAIVLIIFVIGYVVLFDPKATTAGRFIFRFSVSLIGVIGLVFLSLFIDPHANQAWFTYPGDIIWWRPLVRLIVYAYVGFAITGLLVLLVLRKWRPEKLRTSLDRAIVKPRHEHDVTQKGKHTNE